VRFDFASRDIAFALVLLQLMIMPEVLEAGEPSPRAAD
jgi:hypothetical protein